MRDDVYNIIKRVYFDKDYKYFISKCNEEVPLPVEFFEQLKEYRCDFYYDIGRVQPGLTFFIEYPDVKRGEFEASFRSIVSISKIYPLYNIKHEFEVLNKDSEQIEPTLDGFSSEPYNTKQYNFGEALTKILNRINFTKLSYAEMEELVEDLKMPEGIWIFGPQVTVETALFRDVFDIVPEDDDEI